jgi:hypothetical protein
LDGVVYEVLYLFVAFDGDDEARAGGYFLDVA